MQKSANTREMVFNNALGYLDLATLLDIYNLHIGDIDALAFSFRERLAFHYPEHYLKFENLPLEKVDWQREFIAAIKKEFPERSKEFILKVLSAREGRIDGLRDLTLEDFKVCTKHNAELVSNVPYLIQVAASQPHVLKYFYEFIRNNHDWRNPVLPHPLSWYAIYCRQPIVEVIGDNLHRDGTIDLSIGINWLNCALEVDNMEIARALVENFRIPVTNGENRRISSLMYAVIFNRVEFIQFCVDRRADLRINLDMGHEYSGLGSRANLMLLIQVSASVIDIAVYLNHSAIFEILTAAGVQYNFPYARSPLHLACMSGNLALIERFLITGEGSTDDYRMMEDEFGDTPLELALKHHKDAATMVKIYSLFVRFLPEAAIGRQIVNHPAAVELIQSALEHGLDPEVRDNSGISLLHYAAYSMNFELLEILIAACRQRNPYWDIDSHRDPDGKTLLYFCLLRIVDAGENKIIKMLLVAGSNPNDECFANRSALHNAISLRLHGLVDLLIEYGVNMEFSYRPIHDRRITCTAIYLAMEACNAYMMRKCYMGHFTHVNNDDYHVRSAIGSSFYLSEFFKELASSLKVLYKQIQLRTTFKAANALMRVFLQVDAPEILLEHEEELRAFTNPENDKNFYEWYKKLQADGKLDALRIKEVTVSEDAESGFSVSY